MYVYYETFKYPTGFYTHRVTVFENATERLYSKIITKYGNKAVSWNSRTNRIYVRETVRIARIHRNKPRTPKTKHFGEWNFATSRNFALSIFAEYSTNSEPRVERFNFVDEGGYRKRT